MAQNCVSLAGSSQCPAFNASSISTDSTLTGLFPFLSNVTDTASFDEQIQTYIANDYSQVRYRNLIGCSAYDGSNTTNYYARYTTSVLCNAIVQNSIDPCRLTGSATRPLCADTCAQYAESEESISASNYCGRPGQNAIGQIRADFTNCALPADSLSGSCIDGFENQQDNCGFSSNMGALCSYCAASSPNATDSCCVFSNTETRCDNVVLPVVATSTLVPLFTSSTSPPSSSSSATSTGPGPVNRNRGLTGGQIAGIVVGSILGASLLLAMLIVGCVFFRKRQERSPANSVFNQPSQARQPGPPEMASRNDGAWSQNDQLNVLPGGRVTRMSALEGATDYSRRQLSEANSSSDEASPRSYLAVEPPPRGRSGSLSSNSMLAMGGGGDSSPGDALSSPETTQSEQLDFFKDYYSQDEIRPHDLVSTLWAYQPRARDEFELERGDMLKVLGIWDDGWATGVRVRLQAEDWRGDDKSQRDSGMSSSRTNSPEEYGEVKAFPLVCVCLPQHWRQTIEGEPTEETTGTTHHELSGSK
ncbi:hypothetical protein AAFC00_006963 [Neodothiora populina]|uniref:SH3 domain-containing protein n=1 Tax=Neodothiora populina TaxID=2781224 RepID=A0ABR3PBS3_9PEZI